MNTSCLWFIRSKYRKLLSPARRRESVEHVVKALSISVRRACQVIGQLRSTQRYVPQVSADEVALVKRIIELAMENGRYGYRKITAMLHFETLIGEGVQLPALLSALDIFSQLPFVPSWK